MPEKPYSQACENNKTPILEIIRSVFGQTQTVWEIGSGSGQHACYFAEQLPHLNWQPTDRAENLPGIQRWLADSAASNILPALELDVTQAVWPCDSVSAVFTANTLHIMSQEEVAILFQRLGNYLSPAAKICIYGPFNYQGTYTSDSNARFDVWLKNQNPQSCIKDIEYILRLAEQIDCELLADHAMPANNRLLVLERRPLLPD